MNLLTCSRIHFVALSIGIGTGLLGSVVAIVASCLAFSCLLSNTYRRDTPIPDGSFSSGIHEFPLYTWGRNNPTPSCESRLPAVPQMNQISGQNLLKEQRIQSPDGDGEDKSPIAPAGLLTVTGGGIVGGAMLGKYWERFASSKRQGQTPASRTIELLVKPLTLTLLTTILLVLVEVSLRHILTVRF